MDRLFISESIPRNLASLGASLYEGLGTYKIYSYALIAAGSLLLIFCIIKIRFPFPYVMAIALLCIGSLFQWHIRKVVNHREQCFFKGQAIYADVIGHSRTMFILKPNKKTPFSPPRQHFTIVVEYTQENGTKKVKKLHGKEIDIWETNPIGSKVLGLNYADHTLFGEEMGATFKFFKTENK